LPDLLLSTKFFVPPARPGLVTRPRLLKSLNSCLRLPLALITAPPGSGKTTLLAIWIESLREEGGKPATGELDGPPVAIGWVSLDAEDNGLARFWTYAIAGLQKAIGNALHELQVPSALAEVQGLLTASPPPFQIFLTLLINEISSLPLSLVLVLDDYHVIQDLGVSESVAYLVDHCPANLHLVIASRTDPPLPLGRWRARGQLISLRSQELRFSLEEALAFFNGSMDLSLSPENVAELDQRTEGWVAGLQMAAFALQEKDQAEVARTIQAFSGRHHYLLDYFTDEILQRQSPEIQNFLLQTSVLAQMCAELCAAVVSEGENTQAAAMTPGQAQAVLEHLERANLFVVPLDTERRWYRYHHLFNDLLLARLRHAPGQLAESDYRRRAARWHAEQGHLAEAVHQAMQAHDYDLAAGLIESPAQSIRIFDTGEVAAILNWTQELPSDVIRKHPWLKLYQSRALFYTGQTDTAEVILDEIEQEIRVDPSRVPHQKMLLGMVLAHKARYASVRGQIGLAREYATQALEHIPAAEMSARSFVFPTLALSAYRMGDVEEASRLFAETARLTQRAGSRFQTTGNLTNLGVTEVAQGRLREVIRLTRQAIQEGMIQTISLPESGWLRFPLAEALYEQNELQEAETTLVEGLRLVREGKLTDYFGLMPALLARIQFAIGRVDEAQATMEVALATARQTTVSTYVSEIEAYQARLWLEAGELARAERWAQAYRVQPGDECLREIEAITLAETLLASNRLDEAGAMLPAMAQDAQARSRFGREIPIRALLALARQALGDKQGARRELERALFLGEPEGYMRPFLHLGGAMADLLRQFVEELGASRIRGRDASEAYIRRILAAYTREKPTAARRKVGQHPQLIESLTPREMDVLRLLNEGLSNREIAGRLYLSPNTLRVYTTNLYAKLDVHNRTQAVTRARSLGIL
jgi:LuxR family transcriptional regulator, maltose regulon positive regulatory protein